MGIPTDLLYVLLYARGKSMRNNESIPTEAHLNVEMFLLQLRYPYTTFTTKYLFIPILYGPYSQLLSSDLNIGKKINFISSGNGISLTLQGFKYASDIWSSISDEFKQTAIQIKEEFNELTSDQLINYVYKHHQKFTKNPP